MKKKGNFLDPFFLSTPTKICLFSRCDYFVVQYTVYGNRGYFRLHSKIRKLSEMRASRILLDFPEQFPTLWTLFATLWPLFATLWTLSGSHVATRRASTTPLLHYVILYILKKILIKIGCIHNIHTFTTIILRENDNIHK